jgi:ketosteroid isomerase-like protein
MAFKEDPMQEAQNTKLVQDAYAAFGRGDIPALLNTFDDNISWKPITGAAPYVPLGGERRGKAEVAEFFRLLSEVQTFDRFEPRDFVAQGEKVVVLGHYVGGPKGTTKRFDAEWSMVFTVRAGRIVAFQEFTDSAAVNAAWAPSIV